MMRVTALLLALALAACGGDDSGSAPAGTAQPSPAEAPPVRPEPATPIASSPPAEPVNKAPVIQAVSGPSSGLPKELVTLEIRWSDEDNDDVTIAIEQVAGAHTELTLAGNLVMFEVPDTVGRLSLNATVNDGQATASSVYHFDVLPKPVSYSVQKVPSEFSDGVAGSLVAMSLNNHGHVAGSLWYVDDGGEYIGRGAIWFGDPYLTRADDLVHPDDPLYGQRIIEVRAINDALAFAGYIEHPTEHGWDGRPAAWDFVWQSERIRLLQPQTYVEAISAEGEVFGFEAQGDIYRFWLWTGDALRRWDGSGYDPFLFHDEDCQRYVIDDRGARTWFGKGACWDLFEPLLEPFEESHEAGGRPFAVEVYDEETSIDLRMSTKLAANQVGQLLIEGCVYAESSTCGLYVLTPQ
jgi:hypothetical protein